MSLRVIGRGKVNPVSGVAVGKPSLNRRLPSHLVTVDVCIIFMFSFVMKDDPFMLVRPEILEEE